MALFGPDFIHVDPVEGWESMQISVAAPVYNEEDDIERVVRSWQQWASRCGHEVEIVLHNDGSRDRTPAILDALAVEFDNIVLCGEETNGGYGYALSNAIANCTGDYIVTIDSDGQFDLADVDGFLPALEKTPEGVTGRRDKKKDSRLKVLADRCLNRIVRILFGTRLYDTNCALKIIRRDLLQSLRLESTGYPLPTEVCMKLEARGVRLGERPVRHMEREGGMSQLKIWKTGWKMLFYLIFLRYKIALYRAKIIREL